MNNPGRVSRISRGDHLLNLLTSEFEDAHKAHSLFDEFLQREIYDKSFCSTLLSIAKQRTGASWEIRRLAILMLEHQVLRIDPDNLEDFGFMLTQLGLKEGSGPDGKIVNSMLKEGYTTTDFRRFVPEFRRKLERLNRVHDKIRGRRTTDEALHDFIDLSRRECKLSLARYLFTPEEIVDEILRHVKVSEGVRDPDTLKPQLVEDQILHATSLLPDLEAGVLLRLLEKSKIYWVSDTTSSEINSLVEYPATTVVLVIKPPGSDIEFEFKRAGRKGPNSLNVVYARDGYTVAPSHRLDGGSMQYALRGEAESATRLALVYRLVHRCEAPLASYVERSTIYTVPVQNTDVPTLQYFTESTVFGDGFREMRVAMAEAIEAFKSEEYSIPPDLPGKVGLSARFIGVVAPAQAILNGTSSFRLDKLSTYLSDEGPRKYFREGLGVSYSRQDARRFSDAVLEEILGCYRPPEVPYRNHEQYLAAAFSVTENRVRADILYLSLIQQIAKFWGTLLAVRGYSRGESFVARNVGLKSFWDQGEWKVRIIFMDHDALTIPGFQTEDFHVYSVLPSMMMDERYIWGRFNPQLFPTSEVGYLGTIYRIGDDLDAKGQVVARRELTDAYRKTQHVLLTNQRLRSLFNAGFLERLLVWDTIVGGYLPIKPGTAVGTTWKEEMKNMLTSKGYGESAFDSYIEIIESHRTFLEGYSDLFTCEGK